MAVDVFLITQIQAAIGDHRVGPHLAAAAADAGLWLQAKFAGDSEGGRVGWHEGHRAVRFVYGNDHVIGDGDGAFSQGSVAGPDLFAVRQFLADQSAAVSETVHMLAELDHAAVVVLHHLVLPDIAHTIAGADIHHLAANAVAAANVDIAIAENGCGHHRGAAGPRGLPEHIAVASVEANHVLLCQLNVLAGAVVIDGDDRGILGAILKLFAAPNDLAGLFVECSHGALITAGGGNHEVSIDQHALGVTPAGRLAAEPVHAGLPLDAAIEIGADQIALTAHGVNAGAIHRGRASRAAAPVVFELGPDVGGPLFSAGAGIQTDELLSASAGAHGVKLAVGDGETGITGAGIAEDPSARWSGCRPAF